MITLWRDRMLKIVFEGQDAILLLGVTRKTLSEFVNEKSSLSPEMAIRIAKATNTNLKDGWLCK